jgi:hypothetical protein
MKQKFLSKEWEKLIKKGLPKTEVKEGDVDWLLELLGWKKDVEPRK